MKLVDILARELKEWPEGIDCLSQLENHMVVNGRGYDGRCWLRPAISSDRGAAGVIITRAQWQAAVDALKSEAAPAWVGVGLPPIGTVCEYHVGNGPWFKGEIRYLISPISGQPKEVVLFASHLKGEQVGVIGTGEGEVSFRPICTPEQISAEEREREIELAVQMINQKPFCQNSIAVQNGIRHAVGEMIAAGYRKFEIVDKDDGEGEV